MKASKQILSLVFLLGMANYALAQGNFADVLRYSERFYQGTARSAGSGNAFGALGTDFGGISINPAGLGMYRRSDFGATFALSHQTATSTYLGSSADDDKYNINWSSLGLVIAGPQTRKGQLITEGWSFVNFAMGFNRTNNFNSNVTISGVNTKNSIINSYRQAANGNYPSQLLGSTTYGYLAYQSYLIDAIPGDTSHYTDALNGANYGKLRMNQTDNISTTGHMNDFFMSLGGNYSDKIFIGGTFTIPSVAFSSDRTFSETNVTPDTARGRYVSSTLNEKFTTRGYGVNATLGIIIKPNPHFNIGGSVQLPTFLWLHDGYSYSMTSQVYVGGVLNKYPAIGVASNADYYYSVVTPLRTTLSAAYLFGKQGFISADYEYVDYKSSRFNSTFDGSTVLNQQIKNVFQGGNNLRIGAEMRSDVFAFRAGVAYYGSPYKSSTLDSAISGSKANSGTTMVYSLGIGIREPDKNYYLDMAFQYYVKKDYWQPYNLEQTSYIVDGSNITNRRTNFMVTLGTRF